MQIYEILAQRQSHEVDYIHRFLDMLKIQKSLKPSVIADTCMQFLPNFDSSELQEVVEALNVKKRLDVVISLMRKQYSVLKDAFHLSQTFTIDKESKESYLNEELKKLQKESGIASDEKEKLLEKYKQRMENKNIPEDIRRVIKEEMDKLMSLEPMLMEYGVTNNYLDWLTALPWGIFSQDKYDIPHARKVLDEDHYGLKDIKERILEFISVGALTGNVQGKILCLVGPPGTGKTSIGQSIARALDRKFFRFSVGGMNDVAEIKGHRRTYVGAMPGKFIQCLKLRETSNPVILIDEIDKVGNSIMGDPSSALLEALDPQQNATFLDHYLDVPYDLSKVLFVCTANVLDTIPRPLLDRMEVLTLSGYVLEEKMNIVKRHLLPNARKNTQLKATLVKVTDSAVKKLIHQYCREAGVRQLQKQIDNIFSKAAYKLQKEKQTKGTETPITVNHDNLEEYVGKPKYTTDRHYEICPPGVVMGLSWTPMGGSALYVETVIEGTRDHDEGLKTTGQMGEVMKESSNIAFTYARNFLYSVAPENRFFEQYSVHMHLPEGATSKDGPSAGVPMVTSLLSLAINKSVIDDMAISGEITLSGKILPVGAIKEKIIAASRANIKHVILPVDNKVDWEELEDNITRGITPHFVEYYKDVYEIAFGQKDLAGDGSGGKAKDVKEKEQKKKNDNSKEKKEPVVEKKEEKPKKPKKNSPKPIRKQKNEIELPPQPQHKNPDANQIIVNNTNNPASDN
jgi:Lon-like ATP-dependent protease